VKRPKYLDPPRTLSQSPPVPTPGPPTEDSAASDEEARPDPTRYGDWERKGIAVDF